MTPSQLRQWSFQNSQPDQWWLNLDGVTEEIPVTVAEIEKRLKSGHYSAFQVLHVSQAGMENAPWVEVAMPPVMNARPAMRPLLAAAAPAPLPASPTAATAETQKPQEATIQHFLIGVGTIALVIFIMGKLMTCGESSGSEKKQSQAQGKPPAAPVVESSSEWYEGGTLHGATMADWKRASYKDRLATSADFVARSIGGELGDLDMDDDIKPAAVRLELEISAAYKVGVTDNLKVAEMAAMLVIVLKDRGQWLR